MSVTPGRFNLRRSRRHPLVKGPGQHSRYSDYAIRAGRYGVWTPVKQRDFLFSKHAKTGTEAHEASSEMFTVALSRSYSDRGVGLTTHPKTAPRLSTTHNVRVELYLFLLSVPSMDILFGGLYLYPLVRRPFSESRLHTSPTGFYCLGIGSLQDIYTRLHRTREHKKSGNGSITQQGDAFAQPLLPWKSNTIKYAECVSAALVIQHTMGMRLINPLAPELLFFLISAHLYTKCE